MAAVVGFAFLWLSVTVVGKLVFLRVVAATPNAMLCMTTTAATVQKAAFGRKKRPPLAEKKQQLVLSHLYDATDRNKVIIFCTGAAGLFLPPTADFLYLRLFSLPPGRRGWGWRGISESSLSRYLPTHTDA